MDTLIESISEVQNNDSKLVLIVGKPGSGKSKIIHEYSKNTGIPIVDFSRVFANNTKDTMNTMDEFLKNYRFDVLLIDNKTALYARSEEDLKDILDEISKKVVVVSTWNGFIENGQLTHIVNNKETSYPIDGSFKYVLVS
ncbi:MAG TPA: BREX-3 system P-loop-containing protein BrxF [Kandleria vitulina]|jgi:adenylate kinase|nr:BREX-3 system P-loop-containing protein BrxF [Kandleria vitulina]HCY53496.1 BREX-3 system P-loop-containing protein BrxF [Kandleria vitulina]